MSGFAKLTVKALRALAEEYEVQLPAGRIAKNGLIKILEAENIQPPWDGPEWKCPTPASLIRSGLLLGVAPRPIWRAVQARWPDYKGASGYGSVGVYRRDLQKKKLLNRTARLTPAGREVLAELRGGGREGRGRKGRLAPIPPPGERGSLASAGVGLLLVSLFEERLRPYPECQPLRAELASVRREHRKQSFQAAGRP